jgi:hypothetical protein
MIDLNIVLTILAIFFVPGAGFIYYFLFRTAIHAAIEEHQGAKFFNRWIFVAAILILLSVYAFVAKPFWQFPYESFYQPSLPVLFFVIAGVVYLLLEIPYQIVKMAARDAAEELAAVADDNRLAARTKSAVVLADIVGAKLKVACELQAFSSNEEFVFLTYIVNNKPIATRLKLNQADKPENWKKLGEWIITSYQKETAQITPVG